MIINHNITALNTHRQLGAATNAQSKSMEKLASGMRINRAGDDAAGLAISEKMRGQIRGLDQASRNAQDGISLIQTAEGALNETHDILQRMRELAVQSSNDTNTDTDRAELQKEVDQLSQEITRVAENTEFNTKKLINGDAKDVTFHIGANEGQNIKLTINNMDADSLGVQGQIGDKTALEGNSEIEIRNDKGEAVKVTFTAAGDKDAAAVNETTATLSDDGKTLTITLAQEAGDTTNPGAISAKQQDVLDAINKASKGSVIATVVDGGDLTQAATVGADTTTSTTLNKDATKGINISDQKSASDSIKTIENAITTVSAERSKLGANQNRLEHTINNLSTSSENLTAAESRIRDTDMAKTMMDQTKNSILSQAAQAMLAQANQQPQGVLQLLR
ncbi:flagellin [Peribacillus sp. JNUCC41]|uniref:flagellin N-terminal helical domain-containing protein n=1 Tax=Peribacillus sp. JNUCC41 TaxID=2778370 RepID=UPI00178163C5|nr:flagellin [Brevibacillus sp. JNUCC-41]QOS91566.1 flagellin [Brevibacillus sp. JNUCC-41]